MISLTYFQAILAVLVIVCVAGTGGLIAAVLCSTASDA